MVRDREREEKKAGAEFSQVQLEFKITLHSI